MWSSLGEGRTSVELGQQGPEGAKPGIILFGEGWVGTGRSLQECRDFQGGLPGYPSHFQFRL